MVTYYNKLRKPGEVIPLFNGQSIESLCNEAELLFKNELASGIEVDETVNIEELNLVQTQIQKRISQQIP